MRPFSRQCVEIRERTACYGDEVCGTREAYKAWSLNLGRQNVATTVDSSIPVPREQQRELMKALSAA